MRAAILALVVASLLAASAQASGGWTTHAVARAGFSIQTPGAWLDLSGKAPQVLDLLHRSPQFAALATALKKNKSLVLVVVDPAKADVRNGLATNLNVIVAPSAGVSDLKAFRDLNVAQLRQFGILRGNVESSFVALPAGQALELVYEQLIQGKLSTVTQFALLRGGRQYVVTFTTAPPLERRLRPLFERSAHTFHFLR